MLFKASENMTPVENHIINKINENPSLFLKSDISFFANEINVSPSALSRLVKKLKFNNYSELKMYILSKNIEETNLKKINDNNSEFQDVVNIYQKIIQNISTIRPDIIRKIVNDIQDSQSIITYGNGSSSLAALHLNNYLLFSGFKGNSFSDFHKTLLFIQANKNSTLIIFSKELQSMEVRFLIKIATKYKMKFWIITANSDNIINVLNNTISFNSINHEFKGVSISSKIGMLLITDMIIWELNIINQQKNKKDKLLEEWSVFNK